MTAIDKSALYQSGTFGDAIITAMHRFPDRTAFICEGRSYSYEEVAQRISQALQFLRSLGLKKGQTIAQLSRNRPEQWFVMAAAYLEGYISVTLHALASAEEQAFTIDNSDAVLVIADHYFTARLVELRQRLPKVERWFGHGAAGDIADFWEGALKFEPQPLENQTQAEDIIRLGYTGGTTGRAKGVMLSSRALLYQCLHSLIDKDWPDKPIFLCPTPISHGAGASIVPVLSRGGTFILLPGFNAEQVIDLIPKYKVTVLYAVPTMLYGLLDHPKLRQTDLSSLEVLSYGASPASPTRLKEAIEVFGQILCQGYGQTEAPSSITVLRKSDHDPNDLKRLSSCGLPYQGLTVALLDDDCCAVKQGEVGEICVRGPILMSGYWKEPGLTEEVFKGNWLHTGDMAYQDEQGYYFIVDRKKDMIISGGFNVYPKEIENILATHPGVSAAAVIGVPDEKWGEAVKAVIVPRANAQPDVQELQALVKEKKGSIYAPKSIDFVQSFPLTPVGKPDKKALRQRYWGDGRQVN